MTKHYPIDENTKLTDLLALPTDSAPLQLYKASDAKQGTIDTVQRGWNDDAHPELNIEVTRGVVRVGFSLRETKKEYRPVLAIAGRFVYVNGVPVRNDNRLSRDAVFPHMDVTVKSLLSLVADLLAEGEAALASVAMNIPSKPQFAMLRRAIAGDALAVSGPSKAVFTTLRRAGWITVTEVPSTRYRPHYYGEATESGLAAYARGLGKYGGAPAEELLSTGNAARQRRAIESWVAEQPSVGTTHRDYERAKSALTNMAHEVGRHATAETVPELFATLLVGLQKAQRAVYEARFDYQSAVRAATATRRAELGLDAPVTDGLTDNDPPA